MDGCGHAQSFQHPRRCSLLVASPRRLASRRWTSVTQSCREKWLDANVARSDTGRPPVHPELHHLRISPCVLRRCKLSQTRCVVGLTAVLAFFLLRVSPSSGSAAALRLSVIAGSSGARRKGRGGSLGRVGSGVGHEEKIKRVDECLEALAFWVSRWSIRSCSTLDARRALDGNFALLGTARDMGSLSHHHHSQLQWDRQRNFSCFFSCCGGTSIDVCIEKHSPCRVSIGEDVEKR